MNINKVKNYTIIFLSLTAIYLTGQLWFDKISNHNFFYSFFAPTSFSVAEGIPKNAQIMKPFRIITNYGNKTFNIEYNGLDESSHKKDCDEVLALLAKKVDFVEEKTIDWNYLLNSRAFIYDYPFAISGSIFASRYGQKTSVVEARVKSFTSIHIVPNRNHTDKIKVIFVDENSGMFYEFSVDSGVLNDRITKYIQAKQNDGSSILYTSTKQQGLEMFPANTFIPEWADGGFTYPVVTVSNPYAVQGNILLRTIESKIDVFFENPSMKQSYSPGGVFTYSDENTVVKYYPEDVLEYSNYKVLNSSTSNTNLVTDYGLAVQFISNDAVRENEYYLAQYKIEDTTTTFYFNYVIQDLPVLFSEAFTDEIGMEYPMEISIKNNTVVKYKKLVYTLQVADDTKKKASEGFLAALDEVLAPEDNSGKILLKNARFGFKWDKGKELFLYWFMKINNETFEYSAELIGR